MEKELKEIIREYDIEVEAAECQHDIEKAKEYAFNRIYEIIKVADQRE